MRHYYELLPKDGQLLPSVFKHSVDGALRVRPSYVPFTCAGCGRVDANAALKSCDVDSQYVAALGGRSLAETYDHMYVVSASMRQTLESECDDVIYYAIPQCDGLFVIWPRTLILPDDSKAFSRDDQCDRCHIFRSTVFGPEPLTTIPAVAVGAVLLEGPQGPMPAWFVHDKLATVLKAAKLKGLTLVKWASVQG